jgi:integrase
MLTDPKCKNASCPETAKRVRLVDGGGLYLEVGANASKRWFWKYRIGGLEKRMALGSYPAVSLKAAREARDTAKKLKGEGRDPVLDRQVAKLRAINPEGDTFERVAVEWHKRQLVKWSAGHGERTLRQLERDLFPWLGKRFIADIAPTEILATLRKIEDRGAIETADRALMICRQVWRYSVATGRADRDITADLKGALTPYQGKHHAAITDPVQLGVLLRAIAAYKGSPAVRAALQLAPILFQRPGELRGAAWAEVDLDNALWTIPPLRMKRGLEGKENGDPHLVPLPTQAVAILRELHTITGHGAMVFPGERSHERPISDNSVRTALISMGYTAEIQTWHGFRATARTMLAERLEFDTNVIEAQLAHAVKDANGRAYNRTQYMEQRRRMMQAWADYLDKLRMGADVIVGQFGKAA